MGAKTRARQSLLNNLHEGESLVADIQGYFHGGTGVLGLTDQRMVFIRDGLVNKSIEDFPLAQVTSIEWGTGFALGTIKIHAASAIAEIKNVDKKTGATFVQQAREGLATRHAAPPPPPVAVAAAPAAESTMADELVKLAGLHQAGALSDAEFEAAKARLLS